MQGIIRVLQLVRLALLRLHHVTIFGHHVIKIGNVKHEGPMLLLHEGFTSLLSTLYQVFFKTAVLRGPFGLVTTYRTGSATMPHEIHETRSDPIIRRFQPLRKVLRRQPRGSSFELPPNDDVSLLPKSFLLTFRKLTHATRDWVDSAKPSVFSRIRIRFPLSSNPQKLFALSRVASYCQHMDVSFLGMHEVICTFNTGPSLPSFTALTDLHLDCPSPHTIQPLLSFRQALKSPSVPSLTRLTISNLTLEGIKALRFGSFTIFGTSDPTSRQMWQRLRLLDITVVPWFGKAAKEINTTLLRVRDQPDDHETWRTGLRILHNWLESFAFTGNLETLNFRWHGQQGPNPLLLDLVGREPTTVQWFSATAIIWRDLKQTQLMGVRITEEDVKKMQERVPQLRS